MHFSQQGRKTRPSADLTWPLFGHNGLFGLFYSHDLAMGQPGLLAHFHFLVHDWIEPSALDSTWRVTYRYILDKSSFFSVCNMVILECNMVIQKSNVVIQKCNLAIQKCYLVIIKCNTFS